MFLPKQVIAFLMHNTNGIAKALRRNLLTCLEGKQYAKSIKITVTMEYNKRASSGSGNGRVQKED